MIPPPPLTDERGVSLDSSRSFAVGSDAYAAARPRYPADLYEWIASQSPGRGLVWDCATGNGQAAVDLADRFATVYATDISAAQLAHARRRPNICYLAQAAEAAAFADRTFDAVTVATALHWFDFSRFWPEVIRVIKPGGLFCAWGYADMACPQTAREALLDPVQAIVRPFWSPQNHICWRGYDVRETCFPFEPLPAPRFSITLRWTAAQLAAYITTWSAYKRAAHNDARRAKLESILAAGVQKLGEDTEIAIAMPLHIIAGYAA
jgi:ubiquinone/menaquinone biosynthesis C-methylase UbiE